MVAVAVVEVAAEVVTTMVAEVVAAAVTAGAVQEVEVLRRLCPLAREPVWAWISTCPTSHQTRPTRPSLETCRMKSMIKISSSSSWTPPKQSALHAAFLATLTATASRDLATLSS